MLYRGVEQSPLQLPRRPKFRDRKHYSIAKARKRLLPTLSLLNRFEFWRQDMSQETRPSYYG